MSEDKHFRRALVPGLGISALLIGVGFWQSITMGIVCLVGCRALLAIFCCTPAIKSEKFGGCPIT